jgi:hypothetical protein
MIYSWQEIENQKLKYNYHEPNDYYRDRHVYGSVSPVLHLLKDKKDLVIAEIGVFRAESTLAMFEYLDIKKAYLIDPFDFSIANKHNPTDGTNRHLHSDLYNETKAKLEKYESKIEWILKESEYGHSSIPDNELDFIFIDGAHNYEAVYKDLVYYYPKVKLGGIISGDDFSNKFKGFGIIEAVNDVLDEIGYTEVDVYKHTYKPADYYSAFAFTKTIEAVIG